MTKILSYKYINLLVRIFIGIVALWIIVVKLSGSSLDLNDKFLDSIHYERIAIVFILLFVNWGVEAFKWKYVIQKVQKIDFFTAYKLTITGITLGLITPNRIGEIPARALLLNNRKNLKDLIVKTAVGSYAQLIITFLFGSIAAIFVLFLFDIEAFNFYILFSLFTITTLLVFSYFYPKHIKQLLYKVPFIKNKKLLTGLNDFNLQELLYILLLSGFRYLIFALQYYIILLAFNVHFNTWTELLLIPFCFLITSSIPTIVISEIGVRGSVALLIFGVISDNNVAILSASVLLWFINVALPALFGLFFINRLKIVAE